MWSPDLRQGDIVGPEFLPLIGREFKTLGLARTLSGIGEQEHKEVLLRGRYDHLVVASHCCEFNEGKRSRFLVARLQKVQGNLTAEEVEEVRLSNDIATRSAQEKPIEGLDGFLFEPLSGEFDVPMVASFQTITPIPTSMAEALRASKKAELDHEVRIQFRRKLGFFFGRDADDVSEEHKTPAPKESTSS